MVLYLNLGEVADIECAEFAAHEGVCADNRLDKICFEHLCIFTDDAINEVRISNVCAALNAARAFDDAVFDCHAIGNVGVRRCDARANDYRGGFHLAVAALVQGIFVGTDKRVFVAAVVPIAQLIGVEIRSFLAQIVENGGQLELTFLFLTGANNVTTFLDEASGITKIVDACDS